MRGNPVFQPFPADRLEDYPPAALESIWGGFLDQVYEFDNRFFSISDREAQLMDPQQRIMLELAVEVVDQVGLGVLNNRKAGIFIGASASDYREMLSGRWHRRNLLESLKSIPAFRNLPDSYREALELEWQPYYEKFSPEAFAISGNLTNMIAGRVAHEFNLKGPTLVVDTACTSSLTALHLASTSLQRRECDLAFAGGIQLNLSPERFLQLQACGLLSPTNSCLPFSQNPGGMVIGEGAGLLLLKRLEDAIRDQDPIWAVIRGSAISTNGRTLNPLAPTWKEQLALLEETYAASAFDSTRISALETYGAATTQADTAELQLLERIFARNKSVAIGCVKRLLGHTMAASGMAAVIKMALSIQKGQLLPAFPENTLPIRDLQGTSLKLPVATQPWQPEGPRAAGITAFGFGGANAHVILEEPLDAVVPSYEALTVFSRKVFHFREKTQVVQWPPLLLPAQQPYFALHSAQPKRPCNLLVTLELSGQLNLAILQDAWDTVVTERDALQQAFSFNSQGPAQFPAGIPISPVEHFYLNTFQEVDALEDSLVNLTFDPGRPPLFMLACADVGREKSVLILVMHQLIADPWSMQLLLDDLLSKYRLALEGQSIDIDLSTPSFSKYMQEHGGLPEGNDKFWKKYLDNAPYQIALPSPKSVGNTSTTVWRTFYSDATAEITQKVIQSALDIHISPLQFVLSAYLLTLFRHSGQSEMVIHLALPGRGTGAEVEELVGRISESAPFRIRVEPGDTLARLSQRVKTSMHELQRHQGFLLNPQALDAETSGQWPQVCLAFIPLEHLFQSHDPGFAVRCRTSASTADLSLLCYLNGKRLGFSWNYNPHRFELNDIQNFSDTFFSIFSSTPERKWPLILPQQYFSGLEKRYAGPSPNWAALLRLHGQIEKEPFEKALQFIIGRHSMLHTVLPDEGEVIRQYSIPASDPPFQFQDISDLPPDNRRDIIQKAYNAASQARFDRSQFPLFYVQLFKTDRSRGALVIVAHALIADGWSLFILTNELFTVYEQLLEGRVPPDLGVPPPSFNKAIEYWRAMDLRHIGKENNGLNKYRPVAPAGLLNPPALLEKAPSEALTLMLDEADKEQLKAFAKKHRSNLFLTVLTLYARTLSKWLNTHDIWLGTAIPGRDLPIENVQHMVGCFSKILGLRITALEDTLAFSDTLEAVEKAFWDAKNNYYSLAEDFRVPGTNGRPGLLELTNRFYFSFLDFPDLPGHQGQKLAVRQDLTDFRYQAGGIEPELRLSVMISETMRINIEGFSPISAKENFKTLFLKELSALASASGELDAAIITYLPSAAHLEKTGAQVPPPEFWKTWKMRLFPDRAPQLLQRIDTNLGSTGLVFLPHDAEEIFAMTPENLVAEILRAIRVAVDRGANLVSLGGILPARTNYGYAAVTALNGLDEAMTEVQLTTGHAATIVAMVKTIQKALDLVSADIDRMNVALIGFGSVGQGTLSLLTNIIGMPASISIIDLAAQMPYLEKPVAAFRSRYSGEVSVYAGNGQTIPDVVYEADLILGASISGHKLDAEKLRPGTLVIDDSFSPILNPTAAIERMRTQRDIIFADGGNLLLAEQQHQLMTAAALPELLLTLVLGRDGQGLPGAWVEPLLLRNSPDLPPVLGLVENSLAIQFWDQTGLLDVEPPALHWDDFEIPERVIQQVGQILSSMRSLVR